MSPGLGMLKELKVRWLESCTNHETGIARGLVAIPAGLLADKWGSVTLVRLGCILAVLSLLVILVFVNLVSFFSTVTVYYIFVGCLVVLGLSFGTYMAPAFTVFRWLHLGTFSHVVTVIPYQLVVVLIGCPTTGQFSFWAKHLDHLLLWLFWSFMEITGLFLTSRSLSVLVLFLCPPSSWETSTLG